MDLPFRTKYLITNLESDIQLKYFYFYNGNHPFFFVFYYIQVNNVILLMKRGSFILRPSTHLFSEEISHLYY